MTSNDTLVIDVTPEERERIEALAHQRGYKTPTEYVRALIESDSADMRDQAYFWSETWQAGEREADEDIAAGRVETFGTMDELLADLMDDDE
jgi:predicted DNA-binding protein